MGSRVLIADDDPAVRDVLVTALEDAGYDCFAAADGRAALDLTRAARPDLVVLDIAMPHLTGDQVLAALRSDAQTRYLPVLFVTARGAARDSAARLRDGADDYIAKPFDTDELVARVGATLRRAAQLRSLNPLSGLPGNVAIAREIERRLHDGSVASCLYVDIDNFKLFNDHHGFARGDRLIALLTELLIGAGADTHAFVGHVGGDDFVVLAPSDGAEELAREVTRRFDALVPDLYDEEDRARGWVEDTDRRGEARSVPFVTVSIGIVPLAAGRFESATEVARAAAEMKEVAKGRDGSGWAVDRRQGAGADAASPTRSG